jgi:hypothetical protein
LLGGVDLPARSTRALGQPLREVRAANDSDPGPRRLSTSLKRVFID